MPDLYFECQSGISGDMTLGALVALGADLDAIAAALAALPVAGFRLSQEAVKQHGVVGTRVRVEVDESKDIHRSWPEVRDIIKAGRLPQRVEQRSLAAFEKLAAAEARVHGTPIDAIHFHEVGCLDAIVDVAGSMLALEMLGAGRIRCSPLNVGFGTVKTRHGILPVPAPATVELLKGVPCYQNELSGELVTPTGAAIITVIAEGFGPMLPLTIERAGYGAGTREHIDRPNYLRVSAGRFLSNVYPGSPAGPLGPGCPPGLEYQPLQLLTTETDDERGEIFTELFDRLFEAGALDVNLTPIQMKKNRPGVSLHVLADEAAMPAIAEMVLRESSTFGVKIIAVDRYCLPRRIETVQTRYGPVEVKVGTWGGRIVKAKPEFESCRRLAREAGVPLRDVLLHVNERVAAICYSGR